MRTQQKFTNVKQVFHDRVSGLTTPTRESKEQTKFDSTAEFLCYKTLTKYFDTRLFDIDCHIVLSFGQLRWNLDFQITARRQQPLASAILAELVNSLHDTNHTSLSQVFVEYKGFQDKNFLEKMTALATTTPAFTKTIILCSDHDTAFGCYDYKRSRFYCHPIVGMQILESTFRNIINH